jgi:predicted permease
MSYIYEAFNVVLPVFIVIAIGYLLRYKKVVDESFINMAMKVIFNVCLPASLFIKVSQSDFSVIFSPDSTAFILFIFIGTLAIFLLGILVARIVIKDPASRGTFVQGSFRSNYIIIGYSILESMFGDSVIARVALIVIIVIPMYNVLSIWVLHQGEHLSWFENFKNISLKIIKNPLIIGIVLGFFVAYIDVELPVAATSTLGMLGSIGTPLGLLGIGAYLTFDQVHAIKDSLYAVVLKIVVFPLLVTVLAIVVGFDFMDTMAIFVLFGSPTAISSFIMATALGGDSRLAANIVILSTGFSLISFVLGITLIAYNFGM